MIVTPLAVIDAAAAALAVGGVALLVRLRALPAAGPAAYAARIAGTMLVMLGLILIVFTTLFQLAPRP